MDFNEQQVALFTWADQQTGSCNLIARAGTGKCLGAGTMVMLFDGRTIPVESVVPFDLLMGPDSKPRTVLSISRGRGPLYRITPIKGDSWVCNDVHVMTFVGSNHHSGEVIDIELSDHLKSCKTKRPDKEWKLFRVPLSFLEQKVPYDPYVIGSWLGDGTVGTAQWTLGPTKNGVIDYLRIAAPSTGCIFKIRPDKDQDSFTVHFSIQDKKGKRAKKGRYRKHPLKTYLDTEVIVDGEKRIPKIYLQNSRSVRMALLSGLLDTDGSLSSPSTFDLTTKYRGLCDDVLFLSRSLGLAAYMTEKLVQLDGWDKPRTYYRISLSGDFSSYCFHRHTAHERSQIKNVLRTGWNAEAIGVGDYFGFTLDGDGRFLLGDFTVTHNTTTIIELAKRIRSNEKVFLGAFNKSIAEELKTRIQRPNVEAGTMHSLGFKLWRGIAKGRSEIDSKKVSGIIKRFELFTFDKTPRDILSSAVGYGKQSGFGLPGMDYKDPETWGGVFDHYDLWDELPGSVSPDRMIESCIKVYAESLAMCQKRDPLIDFDDMILAPLVFGKPVPMYDWVMIDEAQDTNVVRRKLAEWVIKSTGRMVAVGDPKQAIYGFAGANHDSMDQIKAHMGSVELPLSITYRCPKNVVALAQTLVPDIQAHESAPEGVVRTINHQGFWSEELRDTDVILCRNTRPLIGVAKRLRKMGIPCAVEGANGKALIALASKWGEDIQIGQMEEKLSTYVNLQVVKWEGKNRLDKAEGIRERQECLLDIASELEEFDSVRSLVKHIEEMFGERYGEDNRRILRLCTVHRAKGREWDRVFLLGRNVYMPSKWAEKEWEISQEQNLVYVAWTRSKRELVEVNCKLKKKPDDPEWWEL